MKIISVEEALMRLQKLCSMQEKCERDIKIKLRSWGIKESDMNKVIYSLKENRFLDNERFAVFFVRDKAKINRWGSEKIKYELVKRDIDKEIITRALNEISESTYSDNLKDLILKKKKEIKATSSYEMKGKIIRFAIQRGYPADMVSALADEILKNN